MADHGLFLPIRQLQDLAPTGFAGNCYTPLGGYTMPLTPRSVCMHYYSTMNLQCRGCDIHGRSLGLALNRHHGSSTHLGGGCHRAMPGTDQLLTVKPRGPSGWRYAGAGPSGFCLMTILWGYSTPKILRHSCSIRSGGSWIYGAKQASIRCSIHLRQNMVSPETRRQPWCALRIRCREG